MHVYGEENSKGLSMNTEKLTNATSDVQEKHRQEKKEAQAKREEQRHFANLDKLICAEIYKAIPEIREMWRTNPSGENPQIREKLGEISGVLKYTSTHPKFANLIRNWLMNNQYSS